VSPQARQVTQRNLSLFPNAGGEMMYDIQACQPTHSDQNNDTVTSQIKARICIDYIYIYIFFLLCTHFHRDGVRWHYLHDSLQTSCQLHGDWFVVVYTSFVSFWPTKFLSRRLGASLLCKDSDSGLAGQTKMNISSRVKIFVFSSNRKTLSGPQSASYLMGAGLLPRTGGGGGGVWSGGGVPVTSIQCWR